MPSTMELMFCPVNAVPKAEGRHSDHSGPVLQSKFQKGTEPTHLTEQDFFFTERAPLDDFLFITLLTLPYIYILKTFYSLLPSSHDATSLNQAFQKDQMTKK